ncbi:cytochrome oxidase c subunit VIb-domain-containing protein [Lyophyllum atratum]|nr:cytochrome oxidase c subunit VIb-domain-containing protein [Lyophyllum atratum]
MGWLLASSKPEEPATLSRQERQKCWESRDAYFSCLDRVGVVKPGQEGNACASEHEKYEENCAKSWMEYFNKRRVIAEAQKDRLAQADTQAESARR